MDFDTLSFNDFRQLLEDRRLEHIEELIVNHRDKWNSLVEESKLADRKLRLFGVNIQKKNLSRLNLSNLVIEDSDFSDSDLSDSDLSNSVITRSRFTRSDLKGSNLYRSRISQTSLAGSRIYSSNLDSAVFTGSVNLFEVYWKQEREEEKRLYRTHPEITKEGFRLKEGYEHAHEDEQNY